MLRLAFPVFAAVLLVAPVALAWPDESTATEATIVVRDCIHIDLGPPPYAVMGQCWGSVVNFTVNTTDIP